ncbi:hypothetical protein FA95DRAFT_1554435 [Auriscalpium vulgare]|uniref:Uncharacterized protein n=1 Tax=Auriscalpium vulgare TaxID=40419 RepID=A0ACB8S659_9AGAM|nr:hypothetical protein FA95DRAFT_1554435 [Auriscalpium vulgare]
MGKNVEAAGRSGRTESGRKILEARRRARCKHACDNQQDGRRMACDRATSRGRSHALGRMHSRGSAGAPRRPRESGPGRHRAVCQAASTIASRATPTNSAANGLPPIAPPRSRCRVRGRQTPAI